MKKLFYYELRRLVKNRFFLALLLITIIYSWQTITGEMVLGVGGAAPFSGWSVGACFANLLSLLLIVEVFFLTFLFGEREEGMEQLRRATGFPQWQYGLLRFIVIGVGVSFLAVIVFVIQILFCQYYFQAGNWQQLLVPVLFCLLPAFFLVLGIGMLAGELHRSVLYGLMLLLLCSNALASIWGFDFTGLQSFVHGVNQVPADATGEPIFFLLPQAVRQRSLYFLLGLFCTIIGLVNHFLFAGNERFINQLPLTKKQAVAGLVLFFGCLVLMMSGNIREVIQETTEVAAIAYEVGNIEVEITENELANDTVNQTVTVVNKDVEASAEQVSQDSATMYDSIELSLPFLWSDDDWQKYWQEYQQWGLQQMGDGSAQWHGRPVAQILDCDGSYSSYGNWDQNGANLYIKRNFWGQIDDIIELSRAELIALLQ